MNLAHDEALNRIAFKGLRRYMEVRESHTECHYTRQQLKVAESRVTQLEEEVTRLQQHEHALHALVDAAG